MPILGLYENAQEKESRIEGVVKSNWRGVMHSG
jgi:hypothetical protein